MLRVAEAVHRTDTGRQREANEDSLFARAPVFAVADGMGGAQAGEVASKIAVEAFEPEPESESALAPEQYLSRTVQQANRSIFELAQGDSARSGMGTTLTAAMVGADEVSLGHVGDSRAYRFRDGELSQLTNDHSLVEELRRQGKITAEQAAEHPQRSVITRALGPEPDIRVDTMTVPARDGDVFLLCSDGLSTMLSDAEIQTALGTSPDLDGAARTLVRAANESGGRDNITVVLFRLERVEGSEGAAPGSEDATLIGTTAEGEGLTADAVRAEVEAARSQGTGTGASERRAAMEAPIAVPSGRGEPRGPWRGRIIGGLVLLSVFALLGFGAYYGARQVWFIGSDEGNRVALFRGLPYELPFGIALYSEVYSVPVTIDALPEERRDVATNHELRSREDAVSLIDDLEEAAAPPTPGGTSGNNSGQGAGSGGGSSGAGGGSSGSQPNGSGSGSGSGAAGSGSGGPGQ